MNGRGRIDLAGEEESGIVQTTQNPIMNKRLRQIVSGTRNDQVHAVAPLPVC